MPLTERQQQIVDLLNDDNTVREVADKLGITRNAVYAQISAIKKKGALEPHWTQSGEVRVPAGNGSQHAEDVLAFATGTPRQATSESALEVIRDLVTQNRTLLDQNSRLTQIIDRMSAGHTGS